MGSKGREVSKRYHLIELKCRKSNFLLILDGIRLVLRLVFFWGSILVGVAGSVIYFAASEWIFRFFGKNWTKLTSSHLIMLRQNLHYAENKIILAWPEC